MNQNSYDPATLMERGALWRAEAAAATVEDMRVFCLAQAEQCEKRVSLSQSTPVFSGMVGRWSDMIPTE